MMMANIQHQTDIFIESSTLHDDSYLTCHDIYLNSRSGGGSDVGSEAGGGGAGGNNNKAFNCAAGFSFNLKNDNRFIIWRIIGNKLELIEQSAINKLNGNFKRIHFKDQMIIPKIHLHKLTTDNDSVSFKIVLVVATNSKLYRLVFPFHPHEHTNSSIFSSLSSADFYNIDASNSYQINLNSVDYTDIFVNSSNGETLFAFVLPNNSISCIQMPPLINNHAHNQTNLPTRFEINQPNIVKRLWSGITRVNQDASLSFVSHKFFALNGLTFLVCLCRDFKIKIWSIRENQCILVEDLVKYIKADNIIWEESKIDTIFNSNNCVLTILISSSEQFKICNLKIELKDGNLAMHELSKRAIQKNGQLLDLNLTKFNTWIVYKNENEQIEICIIPAQSSGSKSSPNNIHIITSEQARQRCKQKREKLVARYSMPSDIDDQEQEDMSLHLFDDEDDYEDRRRLEQIANEFDLKEIFLKLIFEPYRFSKQNIVKSLGILGLQVSNEDYNLKSLNEIKEILIQSIERAVQSHPNYTNGGEEEFLALNSKYWSKYYTMLKQYDYDSRLPLGLFVDPNNESIILLVRKNSVSSFNKSDLSQFYNVISPDLIKSFVTSYFKSKGIADIEPNDMCLFLISLRCINDYLNIQPYLGEEEIASSSHDTCQQINNKTEYLTLSNKDFLTEFSQSFCNINELDKVNKMFQIVFDLLNFSPSKFAYLHNDLDSEMETDTSNFMPVASEFTIDGLMAGIKEIIGKRHELMRNLSIFINIIAKFYDKLQVPRQVANELNQRFFETSINYYNSYECLRWMTDIYPTVTSKINADKNLRRTINLIDEVSEVNLKPIRNYNQTLLKSFISSADKFCAASENNRLLLTNFSQLNEFIISNILHFIWPINVEQSFHLVRYLIFNNQYSHLINYCLQTKWLASSRNLRYFLMGHACLYYNNIDQSVDLFLRASYNLNKDQYLSKFMKLDERISLNSKKTNILGSSSSNTNVNSRRSIIINRNLRRFDPDESENDDSMMIEDGKPPMDIVDENLLLLEYYTKVIHYLDLNGNLLAAIELIQSALLKCQFDSNSKSKLYCILFKTYMELDYFDKAHFALMSNLDMEWKKTCLKHFITELCNQNKTQLLINFDYGDMLTDVLELVHSRAQLTDLHSNVYYRVLYALYMKMHDYRMAAFCMYEQAMRLRREMTGIQFLNRQEKCLLACLHALKLVDKKFAWISVMIRSSNGGNEDSTSLVAKRARFQEFHLMSPGPNEPSTVDSDKNLNFQIVDIDEINRNYMMVHYMIKVSSMISSQGSIGSFYSVDELISLLIKNNLFDDAITLCLAFKSNQSSPLIPIISGLVDKCCSSTDQEDHVSNGELLSELDIIKKCESLQNSTIPYSNPYTFKWKLLHFYLEKFNDVNYYKFACKRILTFGLSIPPQILSSYKKLNTHSLLELLVNFASWEEAYSLLKEYLTSILANQSTNQYDLKSSLASNKNMAVSVPYLLVDNLLVSFKNAASSSDNSVDQMQSELKQILNDYLYQVKLSSQSFINLKRVN